MTTVARIARQKLAAVVPRKALGVEKYITKTFSLAEAEEAIRGLARQKSRP
jgi:DNA-binding response OmpR family regulator